MGSNGSVATGKNHEKPKFLGKIAVFWRLVFGKIPEARALRSKATGEFEASGFFFRTYALLVRPTKRPLCTYRKKSNKLGKLPYLTPMLFGTYRNSGWATLSLTKDIARKRETGHVQGHVNLGFQSRFSLSVIAKPHRKRANFSHAPHP